MNKLFVYDNTVEGLFSAMNFAYNNNLTEPRFTVNPSDAGLFDEIVYHQTDIAGARMLYRRIARRITGDSARNIFYCFLSCNPDKEKIINDYINAGFRYGLKLDLRLTGYPVDEMIKTVSRVKFEAHRMLGLVRFAAVENNTFYSVIGPDNDILPLITDHFVKRMPGERWIIHDKKRGTAAISESGRCEIYKFELEHIPGQDGCEDLYSSLWRDFYSAVSIKDRANPRAQKQHMPVRYWKYLVEKG